MFVSTIIYNIPFFTVRALKLRNGKTQFNQSYVSSFYSNFLWVTLYFISAKYTTYISLKNNPPPFLIPFLIIIPDFL